MGATENTSWNQTVLCKNSLKDTPQKRDLRNKREMTSAEKAENIDPDDPEVASRLQKRGWTERSTTTSKNMTRGAKTFSDGCHL